MNSRTPYEVSGFQDRHVRPLRHPSIPSSLDPEAMFPVAYGKFPLQSDLSLPDSFQAAHILPQRGRNDHGAIRFLIVFQNRNERASDG